MTTLKIENTYISGLFDKLSSFTKNKLKEPLSRGSRFKIYFRLESRGNRGSPKIFTKFLFPKIAY